MTKTEKLDILASIDKQMKEAYQEAPTIVVESGQITMTPEQVMQWSGTYTSNYQVCLKDLDEDSEGFIQCMLDMEIGYKFITEYGLNIPVGISQEDLMIQHFLPYFRIHWSQYPYPPDQLTMMVLFIHNDIPKEI